MKDPRSTCLAIQAASTEEQVIVVVREYLSSLSPDEIALLPKGLATLGTNHVEEVVQSAVQLAHHEMLAALNESEAVLLKDAVLVFSTAATRLAALATRSLVK
jgi:hypothetical protein